LTLQNIISEPKSARYKWKSSFEGEVDFNKVRFELTSPVAGNGNLEVYNMMGQRVKTIYQGFISSGTQTFELNLPTRQIASLIYVLRIGDKKITGRLLQINQ